MSGSLRPILAPASLAVVGASRTPGTIGHEIVASLVRCGFTGAVYPVNPRAKAICAIPAFPDNDHILCRLKQVLNASSNTGMVINNQHAYWLFFHQRTSTGILAQSCFRWILYIHGSFQLSR